jgi:hypothetical protein
MAKGEEQGAAPVGWRCCDVRRGNNRAWGQVTSACRPGAFQQRQPGGLPSVEWREKDSQ